MLTYIVGGILTGVVAYLGYTVYRLKKKGGKANAWDFLPTIIENIPQMVFVKDAKNLRFVLFNKAGEELIGIPRAELIGKNDYDFFPKEQADFFVEKDRGVLAQRGVIDIPEEPLTTKSGIRYLHTKKVPVFGKDGNPVFLLGISEDITERREIQTDLDSSKKQLIQSAKMSALGQMAGGIAHEINNPLAIIKGYADDIEYRCRFPPLAVDDIRRNATKIAETVFRITKVIKGLRAFSRDAEMEPPQKKSLREIVEDTLSLCQEKFKSRGMEVHTQDLPDITLSCRTIQISQVLLNLFANSFDATEGQKERWVKMSGALNPAGVTLYVWDSGPGIPEANWENVFVPFFTTKKIGKGTGLGLSICKGLIEAHDGKIEIEKFENTTRFAIFFPASRLVSTEARKADLMANFKRAS